MVASVSDVDVAGGVGGDAASGGGGLAGGQEELGFDGGAAVAPKALFAVADNALNGAVVFDAAHALVGLVGEVDGAVGG